MKSVQRDELEAIASAWDREADEREQFCIRAYGSADDQPHLRNLRRAATACRVLASEMYLAGKNELPDMKNGSL